MKKPSLELADYQYHLPEDRIARYPLAERDQSRLLVFREGKIHHTLFKQLIDFLPVNATLFFNNTKVIPARMLFEKSTGGIIEVFLLNPGSQQDSGITEALASSSPVVWRCTVGNAKRWPTTAALTKDLAGITLTATWADRAEGLVNFSWTPANTPFASVVEAAGAVPLPPYLKRQAESLDHERYQTVYSRYEGAVAAPTAGLHFTPAALAALEDSGIGIEYLTLHVSAGTFVPIKSENVSHHTMHEEEIVIHKRNITSLLEPHRPAIAVGTTAMRTLESIYWFGVLLSEDPTADFVIPQDYPYQMAKTRISKAQALELVRNRMTNLGVDELIGHTALYVMPGYRLRVVEGLVTNFHQPGSSLLLLVSALVGEAWKQVYREALDGGYRFLSYGDSSLLFPLSN